MLVRHGLRSIAPPDRPVRRTGHDIGRSAEGPIVEHSHIFFDRPASRFWRQPLLTLDPFLPIGIRLDQTGIDRKGFAADQSLADAALQDSLKDASQQIALAETAMPVLREGGIILVINTAAMKIRRLPLFCMTRPRIRAAQKHWMTSGRDSGMP